MSLSAADDDDFTPPEAVRVEPHAPITSCPTCGKTIKKHSSLQLLRCAEGATTEEGVVGSLPAPAAPSSLLDLPPCPICRWRGKHKPSCTVEVGAGEYDRWKAGKQDTPPPAVSVDGEVPSRIIDVVEVPNRVIADDLPDLGVPSMGAVDYEAVAAGMRVVLERERDELIRRGGPIEQQNIKLKERVADLLDEVAVLRRRHQGAVEQRNAFEAQLLESQKAMRKLKHDTRVTREKRDRSKAIDVKDILDVVQHAEGWTVRRKGNGHFGIYKDDTFVVDMASTPGDSRTNMNTRVTLRKQGLDV